MAGPEGDAGSLTRRRRFRALTVLAVCFGLAGCSPVYVVKAGLAELRILRARQPLAEVVTDSTTDASVRGKLLLAMEARRFADAELGLRVGDVYTTYAPLQSDTLTLVLSAAYRDRLENKTWWFPVVGRVPYRGYFDLDDARGAQRELEAEGFDTYLRSASAFSTLGWFSDPIPSTLVEQDPVGVVTTVLHELAHAHLWVGGNVRFNESWATFVGAVGAARFFCTRPGGGPDTSWCLRAQARWRDRIRFSGFLDGLVADLREVYGDSTLTPDQKVSRREAIFQDARNRFDDELALELESLSFRAFRERPLNNATLLARMRYYHRLGDFEAFLQGRGGGDLARAVSALSAHAPGAPDPFALLSLDAGAGSL